MSLLNFDQIEKWMVESPSDDEVDHLNREFQKIIQKHILESPDWIESPGSKGKVPESHYFIDLKDAVLVPYYADYLARKILLKACDLHRSGKLDLHQVKIATHTDGSPIVGAYVSAYLNRPLTLCYSSIILAKEKKWAIYSPYEDSLKEGDEVLYIHDVAWSSEDLINACVEYARLKIASLYVLVLVDRNKEGIVGLEIESRLRSRELYPGEFEYYPILTIKSDADIERNFGNKFREYKR